MRSWAITAALTASVALCPPAESQRLRPAVGPWTTPLFSRVDVLEPPAASITRVLARDQRFATTPSRLFPPARDHRYEGAAIGLVLLGGGAIWLGNALCEPSTTHGCTWPIIRTAAIAGFAGGITGALIGAQIPKSPTASTSASQ